MPDRLQIICAGMNNRRIGVAVFRQTWSKRQALQFFRQITLHIPDVIKFFDNVTWPGTLYMAVVLSVKFYYDVWLMFFVTMQ